MATLYDLTGQGTEVPNGDAATAAVKQGQLAPKVGSMVPVINPDGAVVEIAAEDAPRALAGGYTVASDEDVKRAKLENKYGKIGSALGLANLYASSSLGAARGATLGLSDKAIAEAAKVFGKDKEVKQFINDIREAHPVSSAVNEMGGAIASSFVPVGGAGRAAQLTARAGEVARLAQEATKLGEVAAAAGKTAEAASFAERAAAFAREGEAIALQAKGLSPGPLHAFPRALTPTGAADAAGAAIESGVASGLRRLGLGAADAGLGNRALTKAVAMGSRGAFENALYGLGSEISEAELGDHEVNAGKLISHLGENAIAGMLFGAGTGGIGEVGTALLRKAAPAMRELADKMLIRSVDPKFPVAREMQKFGMADVRAAENALKTAQSKGIKVDIEAAVADLELAKNRAKSSGLADLMREYNLDKIGQKASDKLEDINIAIDTVNKRLAEMTNRLDGAMRVGGKSINLSKVVDYIDELKKARSEFPDAASLAAIADLDATKIAIKEGAIRDLNRATLSEAIWLKRRIGDGLDWTVPADAEKARKSAAEEGKKVYGKVSQHIGKSLEDTFGASVAAGYRKLNRDEHGLLILQKAASRADVAEAANSMFGLSDKSAGIAGGVVGMMIGGPTMAATMLGGSIVHKVVRERGHSVAAKLLDRIASIGALQKVVNDADHTIQKSIDAYVTGKPTFAIGVPLESAKRKAAEKRSKEDKYHTLVRNVRVAAANEDLTKKRLLESMSPVAGVAPNHAASVNAAALAGLRELVARIPDRHTEGNTLTPWLERPRSSDADRAEFMRAYQTVVDPMSAVRDVGTGSATRDQMKVLKAVYPRLYEEMQFKVASAMQKAAMSGDSISHNRRMSMGKLFDLPVDSSLDKNFVLAMQQIRLPQPPDQKKKRRRGQPDLSKLGLDFETTYDKRERR